MSGEESLVPLPKEYAIRCMSKFFKHGRPPRNQCEFVKAATDCIEAGAFMHAELLIRKIKNEEVRAQLWRLLKTKQNAK